jgi:hypothetical protein
MISCKTLTCATVIFALAGALQSCSSMQQMAQQQDQYNRNRCHDQFGLNVGSTEYARCVSMGANAYAEAQKNPQPASPGAAAVVLVPAAQAQNNGCQAPASAPKGQCASCSVSCGAKQASCTPGEEWPDGSSCLKSAVCECH